MRVRGDGFGVALVMTVGLGLGCGKGESGGGGGGAVTAPAGPSAADEAALKTALDAANAKVPASLGGKLSFEIAKGEKGRHQAIQPKGWEAGVIPGRVKPPSGASLGFLTAFSTGSNCDGTCEKKDWAAIADKVEFAQFAGGSFTVEKDEKGQGSRFLVAKGDGRVDLVYAVWKDDASRYYVCRATLDKEVLEAAPAFEAACKGMLVSSW
ncbi:MAG: hypothetical protein JNJ59_00840 [Deltaproteobacteria bacterium]|nr:hypothetical protein [Deltaproteobacteria bacterium]